MKEKSTKGKTYEEIYGHEEAERLKASRRRPYSEYLSPQRIQELKEQRTRMMIANMTGKAPWNKGMKGAQIAWNKGLDKSDARVARYARPGLKKRPHTIDELIKMSAALKGRKKPPGFGKWIRKSMAEGRMRPYRTRPEYYNKPERAFKLFLDECGFKEGSDYFHNHRVGTYSIDFAFPMSKSGIEIDGEYWHRDTKQEDHERDLWLAEQGWKITRLPAEIAFRGFPIKEVVGQP